MRPPRCGAAWPAWVVVFTVGVAEASRQRYAVGVIAGGQPLLRNLTSRAVQVMGRLPVRRDERLARMELGL